MIRVIQRLFSHVVRVEKDKEDALVLLCGIALTCVVAFLYLFQPLLLSSLDFKIYDTLLKSRSGRAPSDTIVIVDIDEKSLAQYGQWPWPRYRIAQLIDRLREMGALSVGVDILFAEPDRTSLVNIQKNILTDFKYWVGLSGIPTHYTDNDAMLAEALKKGPFVLGYQFLFGESSAKTCALHPVHVLIRKEDGVSDSFSGLFKASSVDCIYEPLAAAAPASGFFNIKPDHDGIIRRVPLMMEYDGKFYAHLSLAVLLSAVRPEQVVLTVSAAGTENLAIDGIEISLYKKGLFLIPFHGPGGTYRHISASGILNGTTEPREIEGRIVFIGAAAPGLMDIRATPVDPVMTGVEVHANIFDAIVNGDFLVRPKAAALYELFAIVLFGLLSTVFFARYRALANLALFALCTSLAVAFSLFLFRNGIYLSPVCPILAYASNFSVLSLLDFWREERRLKEKTRQQLTTQEAMLETIANITETRDPETGGHIRRTQSYVKSLAEHIRNKPGFGGTIDDAYIEHLFMSAPLHDLGKVGVPDVILLKPGRLTTDEFEEIKKHTHYGKRIIDAAQEKLGDTSFLRFAGEMVFSHHEHWDGKGYPDGIKGNEIPLSGRIMAIADVYDALISVRPYKEGISHEKAVDIILAGRGTQFDPQLIDAFSEMHDTFKAIAGQFSDIGINESFRSSGAGPTRIS
ncbi:MAG TPA: CHASE2 domain-containing protein [Dissulfurispiraceae bacterium]|nr:CHASE2 domain-containing protein [Dissulfurispiraceae bacterium]